MLQKALAAIAVVVAVMLIVPPAAPQNAGLPAGSAGPPMRFEQSVVFSPDDLHFRTVSGYDLAAMEGCDDYLDAAGMPMLPSLEVRVALPAGMRALAAGARDASGVWVDGRYAIYPAQPPRRTNGEDAGAPFVPPDPSVYGSDAPYPPSPVEFLGQTDLAGQGMAVVRISPLVYYPQSGRLRLLTSINVAIQGTSGYVCGDYLPSSAPAEKRAVIESRVRSMVINPESVALALDPAPVRSKGLPAGGPFDYVLITPSSLEAYWSDLLSWRMQLGLRSTVVTTEHIYANYAGASDIEKMRSFVADAYTNWGTAYFLIGGEHENVPFEYRNYAGEDTPGDQCYADFDDDWTHEVSVGRVTANTEGKIARFTQKVFKYEKNPPRSDYPLDVLLIGMDLDAATPSEELKEAIDIAFIPDGFNVTKVYDSDAGNHLSDTVAALNAGQNLVNHADHCNSTYMGLGCVNHGWGIGNGDVDALVNNDQMSVVVSMGCHPNHTDLTDCIAERWVIYNDLQAGIAFTGNSRSGYYAVGSSTMYSCSLDRKWWRGLLLIGEVRLGDTLLFAKNLASEGGNTRKHCEWTFNLLGEPAMPVWTDTPAELDVTHLQSIPAGPCNFTVTVAEAGGGSVKDALVCLWLGASVYARKFTDAGGTAAFDISPNPGTMSVTVSKLNCIPFEGTCTVGNGGGDPVPDIKLNGLDDPVAIHTSQPVTVTIDLVPGAWDGIAADWWIYVQKDWGPCWWCQFNGGSLKWTMSPAPIRFAAVPLRSVSGYKVFGPQTLPAGFYDWYFAVDDCDGFFAGTFIDSCFVMMYD